MCVYIQWSHCWTNRYNFFILLRVSVRCAPASVSVRALNYRSHVSVALSDRVHSLRRFTGSKPRRACNSSVEAVTLNLWQDVTFRLCCCTYIIYKWMCSAKISPWEITFMTRLLNTHIRTLYMIQQTEIATGNLLHCSIISTETNMWFGVVTSLVTRGTSYL